MPYNHPSVIYPIQPAIQVKFQGGAPGVTPEAIKANAVLLLSTKDCIIKFGESLDAATSMFLPANVPLHLAVPAPGSSKIAVGVLPGTSVQGTLYILKTEN